MRVEARRREAKPEECYIARRRKGDKYLFVIL